MFSWNISFKVGRSKEFPELERFSHIKQIVGNNWNLWKNLWFLWKSRFLSQGKCWNVVQNCKQHLSSCPSKLWDA